MVPVEYSVTVFPHVPRDFRQLLDESYCPSEAGPLAPLQLVVMVHVALELLGDPASEEVVPAYMVLGIECFFQTRDAVSVPFSDWFLEEPFPQSV